MANDKSASEKIKDEKRSRFIDAEVKQLFKMCPREQDPVLTILRGHLLTEHYLERLLSAGLTRGDRVVQTSSLSYAQKITVVDALDIVTDRVMQCLRGLNAVRNACAHEMDREITTADVERIGRALGAEFTALRREHHPDVKILLHEVMACIFKQLSWWVYISEQKAAEPFENPTDEQKSDPK